MRGGSGGGALRGSRRGQRFEDAGGQARAGIPNLDRDELVTGPVVVSQAARNALADDIARFPGREPGDVGVSIVVGEHRSQRVASPIGYESSLQAETIRTAASSSPCGWS